MMSSFQPVDINNHPHAVKIACTIQEWCGMVYFQLNNRNRAYEIEQYSYFESEGDKKVTMNEVIQEDALWNQIRIRPADLPVGTQSVLPGATFLRLAHKPVEPVTANITLSVDKGITSYSIEMPTLKRKLTIRFEQQFPFRILGWDDTYPGIDGKVLTTSAERNKELTLDYWRANSNADRILREELGLPKDSQ
jgi:hypothetical protein